MKAKEYLLYGGCSREEYKKVRTRLQYENYKTWRITSIFLTILFTVCLICCATIEDRFVSSQGTPYNATFQTIAFAICAGLSLITVVLLWTIATPKKSRLLTTVTYSAGLVALIFATVIACYDITYSIALSAALAFIGFLYIDKPYKNLLIMAFPPIMYTIHTLGSFFMGTEQFASIEPRTVYITVFGVIVFWLLGSSISSFVNYRRVQNHVAMINYERLGNIDGLTNIYNKNKYDETVQKLQNELKIRDVDFAVVVFDVNRLKETNDIYGHQRGDELLIRAAELIQSVFQKSDLYRIGGDEFCCILTDEDYEHRTPLIKSFHNKVANIHESATSLQRDTSVAAGIATYDPGADSDYMMVFSRADQNMYRDKAKIKAENKFEKKEENSNSVSYNEGE